MCGIRDEHNFVVYSFFFSLAKRYFRKLQLANAGDTAQSLRAVCLKDSAKRFTHLLFRRISCSILRWLITGCWIPPMLLKLVTGRDVHDQLHSNFPPLKDAWGDIDVTLRSMYWNWV